MADNYNTKVKSILEYYRCELHFYKVTKFFYFK